MVKTKNRQRGSRSGPWKEHVCVHQGEALIILAALNVQHKSPIVFSQETFSAVSCGIGFIWKVLILLHGAWRVGTEVTSSPRYKSKLQGDNF